MARQTRACQRTRAAPRSPLSSAIEFPNFSDDHVALDPAQPIEKQASVKMVDFVLEGPRQKTGPFDRLGAAAAIESPHDRALGSWHGGRKSRNTQTALFLQL